MSRAFSAFQIIRYICGLNNKKDFDADNIYSWNGDARISH